MVYYSCGSVVVQVGGDLMVVVQYGSVVVHNCVALLREGSDLV